jgi:bifunctional non-homologous end joining protein LigD
VALQTYRKKRRFDITEEPRGDTRAKTKGNAFVIQKHAARRLHYDLRLELDGVMKSWAVTRGPSLVPGEKRLAIHVEDHPIEYNKFEGTIPQGQYGGGTVMIWDRGRWEPEGDPHVGYRKGHLNFRLEGDKLRGSWHLVRMHKKPGERQEPWLLIKSDDEAARPPRSADILEEKPLSVATGRSMDEITEGKAKASRKTAAKPVPPARTAKTASKRARTAKRPARKAAGKKKTKESDAGSSSLPDFVPPCLATLSDTAPGDTSFVHEIKFDGYRIQARLDHGKVRLLTRKALDWSARFAPIAAAVGELPADAALIDGEIISETPNGGSSFSQLQEDLKNGRSDRFVYFVFDLLHRDGENLVALPLAERKAELQRLVPGAPKGPIRLSESFEERGPVLLKHACQLGLEGIISKRANAPYRSGRGGDWIKTKCSDRQEFIVAGYATSTVDPRAIGALILAYNQDGALHYAGRSGTGYSHAVARDLFKRLQPLRRDKPPFRLPAEETRARNAQWVEPKLVVEANFHGWTHGERVRHASFQGIREDKAPSDVVREVKAMPVASKGSAVRRKAAKATSKSAPAKGGRSSAAKAAPAKAAGAKAAKKPSSAYSVTLTNPDRVYWEDADVTKRMLADFYADIWRWAAPHMVGRPLSLVRCPEGAAGQCFFQKHASAGIDTKHLHLVREPDGDEIISIDTLDGLISLVQAGVLEVHTRGTTIDSLETADRLVFDLDPGPGIGWADIVAAAREVRQRLSDAGLTTFLKTSGGKGLHVVLPIRPSPWDEAKAFSRGIAEQMARDNPQRYTATVKKNTREQRIFVDYLRNSREATAVAPYSTRARPGAPVSVPIAWEELGALTSASRYTVLNLAQRLSRLRKDPWADIAKAKQPLPKARGTKR